MKIDEVPSYEFDLPLFEGYRTESNVKQAMNNLANPKKKVTEWFFWFHILDDKDEAAYKAIHEKKYEDAISIWEKGADKSQKSFTKKQNLALLLCMLLLSQQKMKKKHLTESVQYWHELLNEEKFWPYIKKLYKVDDDLQTNESVIDDFKDNVKTELADIYAVISQKHKDDSMFSEFAEVFKERGKQLERGVLDPAFEGIHQAIDTMESIEIKEGEALDDEIMKSVKHSLTKIQDGFNKLIDLGLNEEGNTLVLRDKAASAIRTIVLRIYSAHRDTDKSKALLNIALKISGTSGLKHRIEKDLRTLQENKDEDEMFKPLVALIEKGKYEEVLQWIEAEKVKNEDNEEKIQSLNEFKKHTISGYAVRKYEMAMKDFNAQRYDAAEGKFEDITLLLEQNADLFNYNKEVVDEMLRTVKTFSSQMDTFGAEQVDKYREQFIENIKDKFGDHVETGVLIVLFDCHMYLGLLKFRSRKRSENIKNQVIGWAVFIGFGLIVAALSN
ncbi:MAG: hypothetical protein PHQ37_07870 [Methanocellales archaeon]|nr:hypothetical protein [Methanocellales archaeon]